MSVTPIDLGYIMGGMGTEGPPGRPPTQEEIQDAINAIGFDAVPQPGSTKLMTSGGIFNALSAYKAPTIEHLTSPTTIIVGPDDFKSERYIGNSGLQENTLSILFPAVALNGISVYIEFRSEGSQDIKGVIESLDVTEGGRLLKIGELSPNAYITRINGTYAFGIWLVKIDVFEANETIPATQLATIVYSGANYAYFSSLDQPYIEEEVAVGRVKLQSANNLKPVGSEYYLGNLYGMIFDGWKTTPTGEVICGDMGEIQIENGERLTLYPVYKPIDMHKLDTWGDGDYDRFGGYAKIGFAQQINQTTTQELKLEANNTIIQNYKELKIKLKVTGRTDSSNDAPARLKVNNTTLVDRDGVGTSALKTTGWIEVTRASASDPFRVSVTLYGPKKVQAWAAITDIRFE